MPILIVFSQIFFSHLSSLLKTMIYTFFYIYIYYTAVESSQSKELQSSSRAMEILKKVVTEAVF